MSADRLVELFVQSSRPDAAVGGLQGWDGRALDAEAIDRGVETMEKLLATEDAIRMGSSPASTFVCLGMALEEKPKLQAGAVRCYEKALQYVPRREGNGGWERAVVLQQLGNVCLKQSRPEDAKKWLVECREAAVKAAGHPRDAAVFGGDFKTQQTRSEFLVVVEKLQAKTCMTLGDEASARAHVAEARRVEAAAGGDAVERLAAEQQPTGGCGASPGGPQAGKPASDPAKELWAVEPKEERRLKEYGYVDEGPTILVMLDLNQHSGLGEEASVAVQSLRQFRVVCEDFSVDVRLRLRRADGNVVQLQLLLSPLAKEIVPEDTVPRLRGKEGRRRLEVRLFKRDKQEKWYGDLVSEGTASAKRRAEETSRPNKGPAAKAAPEAKVEKGHLLNPLSAEELARLPRPSGGVSADNRPSSWRQRDPLPGQGPAASTDPEPAAVAARAEAANVSLEAMD